MQYQFESLKKLCEESLSTGLTVDIAACTYLLADMHNAGNLKDKCIQFIAKNLAEVRATDGWKQLIKTNRMDLMDEIFRAMSI